MIVNDLTLLSQVLIINYKKSNVKTHFYWKLNTVENVSSENFFPIHLISKARIFLSNIFYKF